MTRFDPALFLNGVARMSGAAARGALVGLTALLWATTSHGQLICERVAASSSASAGELVVAVATCPAGKTLTGGSCDMIMPEQQLFFGGFPKDQPSPDPNAQEWICEHGCFFADCSVVAHAVCCTAPPNFSAPSVSPLALLVIVATLLVVAWRGLPRGSRGEPSEQQGG